MQTARLSRRRLLAVSSLVALAGCGFQPIYAPGKDGAMGIAQTGLSQIDVGLIPERTGQMLREQLQDRFERGHPNPTKLYDLTVGFGITGDLNAVQRDNNATRLRFTGTATWNLISRDAQRRTLASGTARSVDGANQLDGQYFFGDLNTEATYRRIVQAVADQMTLQLANYFNKQAIAGKAAG
jgi:LPS-assembly lipoprotein